VNSSILVKFHQLRAWNRHICIGALVLLVGCGPEQSGVDVSLVRLHELHRKIERFRLIHGQLPPALINLCDSISTNCRANESVRVEDAWGQGIAYSSSNGEFELRSAGPDGTTMTDDDLLVLSAQERSNTRGLAGCYVPQGDPWVGVDQGTKRLIALRELMLDTVVTEYWGGYAVQGEPSAFSGGHQFWQPTDSATLVVIWTVGFASERLELTRRDSMLSGRWSIGDDVRHTQASGPILLKRITCRG
jgi:hypothetical protein